MSEPDPQPPSTELPQVQPESPQSHQSPSPQDSSPQSPPESPQSPQSPAPQSPASQSPAPESQQSHGSMVHRSRPENRSPSPLHTTHHVYPHHLERLGGRDLAPLLMEDESGRPHLRIEGVSPTNPEIPPSNTDMPGPNPDAARGVKRRRMHDVNIEDFLPPPSVTAPPDRQDDTPEDVRPFRLLKAPSLTFIASWIKVRTQKFTVLSRQRDEDPDSPQELVEMVGVTTGNLYMIVISQTPSCNCLHSQAGVRCKHIVFVLHRLLNAPLHLLYQPGLLKSELHDLFAKSPIPIRIPNIDLSKRKKIEGECPICYETLEEDNPDSEVTWCSTGCGQNMHSKCFDQWGISKDGLLSCPICRRIWGEADQKMNNILANGRMNAHGFLNFGSAFASTTPQGESSRSGANSGNFNLDFSAREDLDDFDDLDDVEDLEGLEDDNPRPHVRQHVE